MRAAVLTAASVMLTATVLANAWSQRQQFYPSVVYITKSNPSMAVIYIQVTFCIMVMVIISLLLVSGDGYTHGQVDEENILWTTPSSRV